RRVLVLSSLVIFSIFNLAVAAAEESRSETREAWISKGSFDGRFFRYQVTAYAADLKKPMSVRPEIDCKFGIGSGSILHLQAIEVRLLLTASFEKSGLNSPVLEGMVDLQKEIQRCQKFLPVSNAPIAIKLPQISVPSDFIDASH